MVYIKATRTILETVLGLEALSEVRMQQLAALKGTQTERGEPIEAVHAHYLDYATALRQATALRRHRIGCISTVDRKQRTLWTGTEPLLPVLREEAWPDIDGLVHRRLLEGPAEVGPWLTFGWDEAGEVAPYSTEHLAGRSPIGPEALALVNLNQRTFEITEVAPGHFAVHDAFGSEMILVPWVLRELQARIGSKMLAVGVPEAGGFDCVSAGDLTQVRAMIARTMERFEASTTRRISPFPLLVGADTRLIGFASPKEKKEEQEPAAKPWWKVW